MSEASDPKNPGGGHGRDRAAAAPADVTETAAPHDPGAPADGARHSRFRWPHRGGRADHGGRPAGPPPPAGATEMTASEARAAARARNPLKVPTGLGASLATSGGLLLAMVEDVRMRGGTEPEDLRPLADTFARHSAAKEATVRKVLTRHGAPKGLVERDRHEGDLLQGILDRALTGRHPEETRVLTIDGALAQMYQYLFHERRDLVPAIERLVPVEESESLAAAFHAISDG
ncbi:hypothetical protein V2S66_12355 [Streptomyces sp. V4-01]|uniref:DUF892 family protein n=1 Tax=Actinacidiphila polyblastidii TaxID=3110430 RepID=A0ABU7PAQ8_9ACTN|nr:hypothetical protein [Streptomyces sp. V4-01]